VKLDKVLEFQKSLNLISWKKRKNKKSSLGLKPHKTTIKIFITNEIDEIDTNNSNF